MGQAGAHIKMLGSQGVAAKSVAVRNKLIKKIVILLAVIVLSALFCVWSRVRIVQLGYEITELKKQEVELAKKMNHTELEVESLKSPGRLQKVAVEVLKMHPPSSEEMFFVKKVDIDD